MNTTLIRLRPGERYTVLSTYDRHHGQSARFLFEEKELYSALYSEEPILCRDLYSFAVLAHRKEKVYFHITWLNSTGNDTVTGYMSSFAVKRSDVEKALSGMPVSCLWHETREYPQAKLAFTKEAMAYLKTLCEDSLNKRALVKFFRDSFRWGKEESIRIAPDKWVKGFYYRSGDDLDGGIVRHTDEVMGNDGKNHMRVRYEIHT